MERLSWGAPEWVWRAALPLRGALDGAAGVGCGGGGVSVPLGRLFAGLLGRAVSCAGAACGCRTYASEWICLRQCVSYR